jgi:hypothetical protein
MGVAVGETGLQFEVRSHISKNKTPRLPSIFCSSYFAVWEVKITYISKGWTCSQNRLPSWVTCNTLHRVQLGEYTGNETFPTSLRNGTTQPQDNPTPGATLISQISNPLLPFTAGSPIPFFLPSNWAFHPSVQKPELCQNIVFRVL